MNQEVRFGAMSDPLHVQLGIGESVLRIEQRLADALVLCHVQGILTDAEVSKARKRLFKMLENKLKNWQRDAD